LKGSTGKRQKNLGDRSWKKKKRNFARNYQGNLWPNYYIDGGEKDMKKKERGDGTRIGIDRKNSSGRGILKGGPCYESPKKGTSFPCVQTLSRKYQVVQCRQDINSVGT